MDSILVAGVDINAVSNADETPLELARKGPKLIASTIEKFISRP